MGMPNANVVQNLTIETHCNVDCVMCMPNTNFIVSLLCVLSNLEIHEIVVLHPA